MDFETIAEGYESWYETPKGRRADRLEKALLDKLLERLPEVRSALEVGCGTGHFTRWLAGEGSWAVGVDLSSAMLVQAQRLNAPGRCPYLVGDGLTLPFPDLAFDVVALITTLEFVAQPERLLAEAGRVARRGVLLGVLNRYSLLALRRRWRSLREPTIYDQAHFFTVGELRQLARRALGVRLQGLVWRTTLLHHPWPNADARLLWGGFVGMLLELKGEENG
ncbi:MAG: class I SAM-dependent methyltransferase [Chloroflexota bacterium]|nr:class I SAM-dependent methyltransferase [Chloroflexota bacterium]